MSQKEQHFELQKIYLKDCSFESPQSPLIFSDNNDWTPEISMDLNSGSKPLADNVFEVELTVTVTSKFKDKIVFLTEVKYAGIFTIANIEGDHLAGMLGSYCPNLLFPYIRETVSDLISKGGFPQLLLNPVNFDALFAQHQEKLKESVPESPTEH
jgi:preprotein translocase subunit SecB